MFLIVLGHMADNNSLLGTESLWDWLVPPEEEAPKSF